MLVYTMGYTVPGAMATLEQFVGEGGKVFDIRYSPSSANPLWRQDSLRERFGSAYRHVRAWGNKNYKNGGPIELVDFAAGLRILEATTAPVVALCMCRQADECHRAVVAAQLRLAGHEAQEIAYVAVAPKAKPQPVSTLQPALFGG